MEKILVKNYAAFLPFEKDEKKYKIITDKDGNIVEYCDANGFHAIRYRDEYVCGVWLTPNGAAPDVVTVTIGGVLTQKIFF